MLKVTDDRIKSLCSLLALQADDQSSLLVQEIDLHSATDLFELANQFWLGPALASVILAFDLTDDIQLLDYCRDLSDMAAKRNQENLSELYDQLRFLNDRSIEPLLIKGCAELLSPVDEPQGRRWMMDIDLVIDIDELKPTWQALVNRGYQQIKGKDIKWDEYVSHHAPAISGHRKVTVELHHSLVSNCNDFYQYFMDSERCSLLIAGQWRAKQLNPTDKVILAISHDMISHQHYVNNKLELRYCYNLFLLIQCYGEHIDWTHIGQVFAGQQKALNATLMLLQRYFNLDVGLAFIEDENFLQNSISEMNQQEIEGRFTFAWTKIKNYFLLSKVVPRWEQHGALSISRLYLIRTFEIFVKLPKLLRP